MMHKKTSLAGKGIKVASFFSGAGGLDFGFHELGCDVVFATDIEKLYCDTLNANKGKYVSRNAKIIEADIRELSSSSLPSGIDLVIGGPPCQSFSASGRRAGGAAGTLDKRGSLFEAYCCHIKHLKPKAFVFENVRGILGTNLGNDWREIVDAFSKIGYSISFRLLDACDYGIPQHRERMILVGHLGNEDFLFPAPVFGPDSREKIPHPSPSKAFSSIIDDAENIDELIIKGGKYSYLIPLVPPGDNYLYFTAHRGCSNPVFAYRSRFSDFLYKANPDYPVKTIIASPGKYTGPFHWDNRYFTILEYKVIQGFPLNYKFCGNRSEIIRQIGNSVSPKLSIQLAKAVLSQIFNKNMHVDLLTTNEILSFDKRKGRKAQKTKDYHRHIEEKQRNYNGNFKINNYRSEVSPHGFSQGTNNVYMTHDSNILKMIVRGDACRRLFAKMTLTIHAGTNDKSRHQQSICNVNLDVRVYGERPHCIQTMWNAIDSWVIQSSNYHSLFELYGHFTEPHPIFEINEFVPYSNHPIVSFAKHVSDFSNCSRYFTKQHLIDMFGNSFNTKSYIEIANILRGFRFDVRSNETNVAMPSDVYMVSYPFTLPYRKQMNFSIKETLPTGSTESYVNYVRIN